MRERKIYGYFTVEATLIMPIVLFMMIFVISIAFFEYNRCILEEDIKILALRASNQWYYTPDEVLNELYQTQNDQEQGKMIAMNLDSATFEVDQKKISVLVEGKTVTWLKGEMDLISDNSRWNTQLSYKIERYNPSQFLKDCRKVEYIANRLSK